MAGRPTRHTATAEAEIMGRLMDGESLRSICASNGMPPASTVRQWIVDDKPPGIAARYARARNIGLDQQAEAIQEISDDKTDDPNSRRVRIDARKWLLSKMRPDKYGDRAAIEHSGPAGGPVEHIVKFVRSNGDGRPGE